MHKEAHADRTPGFWTGGLAGPGVVHAPTGGPPALALLGAAGHSRFCAGPDYPRAWLGASGRVRFPGFPAGFRGFVGNLSVCFFTHTAFRDVLEIGRAHV